MSESAVKVTPVAGRVSLRMKEAITGSVCIAILVNLCILIIIQAGVIFLSDARPVLFSASVALLVAADIVLCIFIFRVAISEVRENCSAPSCTIAFRSDGYIVIYHRDGSKEIFSAESVMAVRARTAKLGYLLSGWAYLGKLNYGKVTFVLKDGRKLAEKSVRYVVNCRQAAGFINGLLFSPNDGNDEEDGRGEAKAQIKRVKP